MKNPNKPKPLWQDTHKGVTATLKDDGSMTASSWVSDDQDDRIERSLDFLCLKAVTENQAAKAQAHRSQAARRYSDEEEALMLEIILKHKAQARNYGYQARIEILTRFKFESSPWETDKAFNKFANRLIKKYQNT
jgi:hypothetical protein